MNLHCCWVTISGVTGVSKQSKIVRDLLEDEIDVTLVSEETIQTQHRGTYIRDDEGIVYPVNSLGDTLVELEPDIVVFHQLGDDALEAFDKIKPFATTMVRLGANFREYMLSGGGQVVRMSDHIQMIQEADHVIASSGRVKREMSCAGIPRGKVSHIPSAIGVSEGIDKPRELPESVGLIGRIGRVKNQMTAFEAVAGLREKQFDASPKLVIAGQPNDNTWGGLQKYVQALTPNMTIEMRGVVDDPMETFYPDVGVLLHPSWTENCPQTILEAAVCGIPCIVSDLAWADAYPEMDYPRCNPDDPAEWRKEIDRILSGKKYHSRIVETQREAIREHYSAEVVSQQYLDLFEDVVDKCGNFTIPYNVRSWEVGT